MIHHIFRRRILVVGALAITVTAGACTTTPTPYQPYRAESAGGIHGGYSDQRLAPNRYRVRFHGNELTSRERVETYLLYRAAELTVANGYDWFAIADRHDHRGIGTRILRRATGAAICLPTGTREHQRATALRAKAIVAMPMQYGTRLREQRRCVHWPLCRRLTKLDPRF